MSTPSQAVMAISMYSEIFARSRGQDLLFVNLVRGVRCDPPQDTVQSDQQSMGSGAAISPPGFDAKTMHRLPAPLPQTGYDAPACKTNVQGGCRGNDGSRPQDRRAVSLDYGQGFWIRDTETGGGSVRNWTRAGALPRQGSKALSARAWGVGILMLASPREAMAAIMEHGHPDRCRTRQRPRGYRE